MGCSDFSIFNLLLKYPAFISDWINSCKEVMSKSIFFISLNFKVIKIV